MPRATVPLLTLTSLMTLLWVPGLSEEWHAAQEVVSAVNDRRTTGKLVTSAVLDSQGKTIWILQMDCSGSPKEPQVVKVELGQNSHSLSHVVTWSHSWPMLWHCGHWRFPAHFDDATKSVVFFGGLSGRQAYKSSPGTRRRYSTYNSVNFSSQVWALSTRPSNYSWSEVPVIGRRPPARGRHASTWDPQGRRMWILGGAGGDGGDYDEKKVPTRGDLWQGQFNNDNSVSWTMLKAHRTWTGVDAQLLWDAPRSAVWALFRSESLKRLELWCYLTQQQYWRDFSLGKLVKNYQPAALVWHGRAQEILFVNGTKSWIFNPSTSAFQAPSVITAGYLPSLLGEGRYVWDEAQQEAIFVGFYKDQPEIYKLRLHASCAHIYCPSGYLKNLDSHGHSVAECCGQPCSSFLCPVGFEQIHDAAWLVGETQGVCCRTAGSQPKEPKRIQGGGSDAGSDNEEASESKKKEDIFLWVAIGAIGLLLLVVLVNFYLLRKKCSFKRSSRNAGQDLPVDSSA